jgi:HSP20 family protein
MADDLIYLVHALFLPAARRFQEPHWRPAADIYRTSDGWLVKLDLAGVRGRDIAISVCGRHLTVSGCRRDWVQEHGHRHYQMEIAYSRFERTIELPCDLESAHISTEYREGMLLVWIAMEGQP